MNEPLTQWVWLSLTVAPATRQLSRVLARFGDASHAYEQRRSPEFIEILGGLARRADPDEVFERAKAIARDCERLGVEILSIDNADYPRMLAECSSAPAVLYVTGDKTVLNTTCIAGVGTRSMSQYGREVTALICAPLAGAGVTLVSGLAHGVDAEVHKAALKAGGKTVAVLGTAIDHTYPATHTELRRLIEHNGAVISECSPGAAYGKASFPQRNRIIAGMSLAVMLFEAAAKSGSVITANWALDFSREVMCVPGSILSLQSEGTNRLIAQGATPISSAGDVFAALGLAPVAETNRKLDDRSEPSLVGLQKLIYDSLKGGALSLDELTDLCGYPVSSVAASAAELEIDGVLVSRAGSYSIK